MLRYYGFPYAAITYALDLVATLAALCLANMLVCGSPDHTATTSTNLSFSVIGLTVVVWSAVFSVQAVYAVEHPRDMRHELRNVLSAAVLALFVFKGILDFVSASYAYPFLFYFFAANSVLLLGNRAIARPFLHERKLARQLQQRVLVVGANKLGLLVAQLVQQRGWRSWSLVGFLDDDVREEFAGKPVLGRVRDIRAAIERHEIRGVVIALPHTQYEQINLITKELRLVPVYIQAVPDYLSLALYESTAGGIGGLQAGMDFSRYPRAAQQNGLDELHLINLRAPVLTQWQCLVKRLLDLTFGSLLILIFFPVMIVTALAIKLDSPGPIIFAQQRVGENGRLFRMYKFRSMYKDAGDRAEQITETEADCTVVHKVANDPRVTRVGRFIRCTSVDELPQLFNVIKGDMSLVGPRPEMPWLVELYETWQYKRFAVPQGMTGWWQINGRGSKLMHQHTDMDLYYIQNYSLWLDILILLKTIPAVIRRTGAF